MKKDYYQAGLIGLGMGLVVFLGWNQVNLIPFLLIIGVVAGLYFLSQGKVGRGFETVGNVASVNCESNISFNDIGGQEVAKRELLEALDFLRLEEKIRQLGIRPLKGILLTGPPGTGKTLLAKAASQYTNSVFVAASGAEFVEMYAGVGAQRVRQLFSKARQLAKKVGKKSGIIFIDEIEVIAGKRGSHTSHLEYDQTLNQLLTEMDGLKPRQECQVVVIAATNRLDMLDPALIRPGRFDRQVKVDLPDREGRLRILEIHAQAKPLAAEVNLEEVAQDTYGFSGAHLESVVNEAAILAFRQEELEIRTTHLREAIDKVLLGEKLDRRPAAEELRRVAIHEIGHGLMSEILRPESVASLTVIPRGKALGFMRQTQKEEQYLYTAAYLQDQIAICLGGAVAEKAVYGHWSTGAANDFEQATDQAKQLIEAGLSRLGIISKDYMEKGKFQEVMTEILEEQLQRVGKIIAERQGLVLRVCEELQKRETVSGEWFRGEFGRKEEISKIN